MRFCQNKSKLCAKQLVAIVIDFKFHCEFPFQNQWRLNAADEVNSISYFVFNIFSNLREWNSFSLRILKHVINLDNDSKIKLGSRMASHLFVFKLKLHDKFHVRQQSRRYSWRTFFAYRMEFDKTRWPCPSDSDQTCTNKSHNSARVNFCLSKTGPCTVISSQITRIKQNSLHRTKRKQWRQKY